MKMKEVKLTRNSYCYRKAKEMAEKVIKRSYAYLMEHEDEWNTQLNLKLYDAYTTNIDFEINGATVSFSEDEQTKYFDQFCIYEYDNFVEWLAENGIDKSIMDYVGRTSSFYLGELHTAYYNGIECLLAECSTDFDDLYDFVLHMENDYEILDYMDAEEDADVEQEINDLLNVADNMYNEVVKSIENVIKVYDYITNFKENQVENFKDFVRDAWIENL